MVSALDVAAPFIGYAVGSVPIGLWLGRVRRNVDVREHGSGSMGTTNVLRIVGPGAAAVTFVLDVAKGVVAIAAVRYGAVSHAGEVMAGLGAVAGHCWPVFARFRGGKGVATGFGGLIMLAPATVPWALGAGVVALVLFQTVSLASLTATTAAAVSGTLLTVLGGDVSNLLYIYGASIIIVARHAPNISRLVRRVEPRVSLRRR